MFWSKKKMTQRLKYVNYPCFISRSCRSLAIRLLTGSVSLTPPCVPLAVQLFRAQRTPLAHWGRGNSPDKTDENIIRKNRNKDVQICYKAVTPAPSCLSNLNCNDTLWIHAIAITPYATIAVVAASRYLQSL